MKKIKLIVVCLVVLPILSFLLSTSCSDDLSPAEIKKIQKETAEQQAYLREQNRQQEELQRQHDSLITATLEQKKQSLKDSIQIIKAYTSTPNSVGGVDLTIVWKNKTKRVIKYANFRVSAINAVGDEVRSEISHYGTAVVTGPIKPNSVYGYGKYWDCMWYNSTIVKCDITSVELEFMDGTTLEITL
jgi:carboxypeptidase C (cathepsin A)